MKTEDGSERPRIRAVGAGYWSVTPAPEPDPSVRKMPFTVARAGEDVPVVLWLPERPARRRPLVLRVRYYVRRAPSPGDTRWATVGLDV